MTDRLTHILVVEDDVVDVKNIQRAFERGRIANQLFFAGDGIGLIDRWRAAKRPVEFHLYEQGGHGFGMYQKPTTSTGWFDAYVRWLGMHGLLAAKK